MKSRAHRNNAERNTPEAIIRRRAMMDARREALAEVLPPIPPDPAPGDEWVTLAIIGKAGVLRSRTLYVPARGHRCDQHCDADGRLVTATELAEWLRGAIPKRPSYRERAEMRRFGL
jgi:hypothetical protein